MTRKTSFYKVKSGKDEIVYRDLTVLEISYLLNVKNEIRRFELAAKVCITEPSNLDGIAWHILQQVGRSALENSTKWISDTQLFEILVKEYREDLKDGTSPLSMIKHILVAFPGQSITDLLKLTWKDLIELACLSEEMLGKKIFNVAGAPSIPKNGRKLVNPHSLDDDGKSLQDKMNALNASLGGIPK
jgi:hypothetical protein